MNNKYADSSHDDEDGHETQHAKDAEAFALQRGVLEGGRLDLFLGPCLIRNNQVPRLRKSMATDRASTRYLSPEMAGAFCHSTMSRGD